MEFKVIIDETKIIEIVEREIAKSILNSDNYIGRESKHGIRNGVDKAIKEYIYKEKDRIIERVVDRATIEIVKKGLPKLLENLGR